MEIVLSQGGRAMESIPQAPVPPTRAPSCLKVFVSIVVGIILLLVSIDILGLLETIALNGVHANKVVFASRSITLTTSTFLFVATLVILVVCLVLILKRILRPR